MGEFWDRKNGLCSIEMEGETFASANNFKSIVHSTYYSYHPSQPKFIGILRHKPTGAGRHAAPVWSGASDAGLQRFKITRKIGSFRKRRFFRFKIVRSRESAKIVLSVSREGFLPRSWFLIQKWDLLCLHSFRLSLLYISWRIPQEKKVRIRSEKPPR